MPTLDTFEYDNLFAGSAEVVRGAVTVASGATYARGTVLGKITKAMGAVTAGANTGTGTVTGTSLGKAAKIGGYILECITAAVDGGTFKVIDPHGIRLDDAEVGVAYAGPINFTINDGATDFAVGDQFTVDVDPGSGQAMTVDSAVADGSGEPAAILAEDVDATTEAKPAVVYLTGEFNENALTFGGTDTADAHRIKLRELGIFLKTNQGA